ncbi:uncharacterized protein isoform X2 [Danio rerio]|uniref:Uncharacterized protein isoform X2 n=1 Tax=Danio rerio TaxID=7955 RepID=A0AC58HK62_DANRE
MDEVSRADYQLTAYLRMDSFSANTSFFSGSACTLADLRCREELSVPAGFETSDERFQKEVCRCIWRANWTNCLQQESCPYGVFLLPRHGWHGRCAVAMVTAVGLMAVGVREVLISCTCVCERRCAPCRCSSAPSCFLPAAAAPSSASLTEFCSSCRHHGHDSHSGQPSFFKEPYFAIMAVTLIGTDDGSSRLNC